ncbi:MAG: hypothetical protein JXB10_03065 [Pirellulales bacterium]|nr:hypothetical protein [Pirellulales bacterium]
MPTNDNPGSFPHVVDEPINPYESPRAELAKPIDPRAAKIAEMILRKLQEINRPRQEYCIVDGRDNRYVSQRFYERVQAEFERLGFTFLGDVEIESLKNMTPNMRTFLRIMTDRNRTTAAAFYHVAPNIFFQILMVLFRFPRKLIELESYTDGGCTYSTTKAPRKMILPHPDIFVADHVSPKMSVSEMYERHLNTLSKRARNDILQRIQGIRDVIDFQNLQHQATYDHLKKIGWVTKEYLLHQKVPKHLIDDVYDEIQRLARESPPSDDNRPTTENNS